MSRRDLADIADRGMRAIESATLSGMIIAPASGWLAAVAAGTAAGLASGSVTSACISGVCGMLVGTASGVNVALARIRRAREAFERELASRAPAA